ncbi:hypothetical protein [Xanthobacter tagetidis]|uniref:Head-tail adaptor protein n=1 Tax=Xanthobacter tagetidis TaxID=60216 RepID=A0A3L7AKM5_9HYPH|nr:hypothetical protein [Xanthobacter tagetidis]MBB6308914.1 hypothetical protein [Xanthobacter tagetidis]RLP80574.1 hypothetical protein D9R14_05875 [Xanthobacter tagetidis]
MPSPFAAALAAADSAFDGTFGERVRITPMAGSPNGRPSQDPARAAWEGIAPVGEAPETVRPLDARGTAREDRVGTIAAAVARQVSLTRAVIGALEVRRGDRVSLLDRPGVPVFAIARVDRDDPTRLILILESELP